MLLRCQLLPWQFTARIRLARCTYTNRGIAIAATGSASRITRLRDEKRQKLGNDRAYTPRHGLHTTQTFRKDDGPAVESEEQQPTIDIDALSKSVDDSSNKDCEATAENQYIERLAKEALDNTGLGDISTWQQEKRKWGLHPHAEVIFTLSSYKEVRDRFPKDPGAIVYWWKSRKKARKVMMDSVEAADANKTNTEEAAEPASKMDKEKAEALKLEQLIKRGIESRYETTDPPVRPRASDTPRMDEKEMGEEEKDAEKKARLKEARRLSRKALAMSRYQQWKLEKDGEVEKIDSASGSLDDQVIEVTDSTRTRFDGAGLPFSIRTHGIRDLDDLDKYPVTETRDSELKRLRDRIKTVTDHQKAPAGTNEAATQEDIRGDLVATPKANALTHQKLANGPPIRTHFRRPYKIDVDKIHAELEDLVTAASEKTSPDEDGGEYSSKFLGRAREMGFALTAGGLGETQQERLSRVNKFVKKTQLQAMRARKARLDTFKHRRPLIRNRLVGSKDAPETAEHSPRYSPPPIDKEVLYANAAKDGRTFAPLVGTITLPNDSSQDLLTAIEDSVRPLDPAWWHGQRKQSLLLLLTPAYAKHFADRAEMSSKVVSRMIRRLFARKLYNQTVEEIIVGVAIVDKLQATAGGKESEGREGMTYALVDELEVSKSENTAARTVADGLDGVHKFLTLIVESDLSEDDTEQSTSYSLQLPLANTVFQTDGAFPNILASWTFENRRTRYAKETEGEAYGTNIVDKQADLTHMSATIRMKPVPEAEDLNMQIFTPLKPLTEPRRVEAAMGNIVRQLTPIDTSSDMLPFESEMDDQASESQAVEPMRASKELEDAVNDLVAKAHLPPGPVAVWALIIKKDVQERLSTENVKLPKLSMDDFAKMSEHAGAFEFPDLTPVLRAGGRLHRVVSGGGGWGKKAGLLSIAPATSFDTSSKAAQESDLPPWMMSSEQEMSEALGSPIEPGDHIQFYAAIEPHENMGVSAAFRVRLRGKSRPLTMQVGTIPSSVDAMPTLLDSSPDAGEPSVVKKVEVERRDNFLGVYSERGFALKTRFGDTKTQSMIDVPFSRLRIMQKPSTPGPGPVPEVKAMDVKPKRVLSEDIVITPEPEGRSRRKLMRERLIRKIQIDVGPKLKFHIQHHEHDDQSRLRYRNAVGKEMARKRGEEIRERQQNAKDFFDSTEVLDEVLDEAKKISKIKNEQTVAEDTNAKQREQTNDVQEVRQTLAEMSNEYEQTLEGKSEVELAREKHDLDIALGQAKLARREASKAIRESDVPSESLQGLTEEQGNFNAVRKMSFEDLSRLFLELRRNISVKPESRNERNMDTYWKARGFPPQLVTLMEEFHSLTPKIPESAVNFFAATSEQFSELPFADLRAAARRLTPEKEAQFWRKWQLLRHMRSAIRARARDDFTTFLKQRAELEKAQGESHSSTLDASHATEEKYNDLGKLLFRYLRRSGRMSFWRKNLYWTNVGLPHDVRMQLWSSEKERQILMATMQYIARQKFSPGDAIGATLLETIAWKSMRNKAVASLHIASPKLQVSYEPGNHGQSIEAVAGVNLDRPAVASNVEQPSTRPTFSETSPWEFMWRYFSGWGGRIPTLKTLIKPRSDNNNWGIKVLNEQRLVRELGPIFAKFDRAIIEYGGKDGLAQVDIGEEVRKGFPHLLNTDVQLPYAVSEDPPVKQAETELGLPAKRAPRVRRSKLRLRRVYRDAPASESRESAPISRSTPLFRSIRMGQGKPGFRSQWRDNPNSFAWDLMRKKLRTKISNRIKERMEKNEPTIRKFDSTRTPQATLSYVRSPLPSKFEQDLQKREQEDDENEDVDYEALERQEERKLDFKGARRFRKLIQKNEQYAHADESWAQEDDDLPDEKWDPKSQLAAEWTPKSDGHDAHDGTARDHTTAQEPRVNKQRTVATRENASESSGVAWDEATSDNVMWTAAQDIYETTIDQTAEPTSEQRGPQPSWMDELEEDSDVDLISRKNRPKKPPPPAKVKMPPPPSKPKTLASTAPKAGGRKRVLAAKKQSDMTRRSIKHEGDPWPTRSQERPAEAMGRRSPEEIKAEKAKVREDILRLLGRL